MGTICNMKDLERTWNLNSYYLIFAAKIFDMEKYIPGKLG